MNQFKSWTFTSFGSQVQSGLFMSYLMDQASFYAAGNPKLCTANFIVRLLVNLRLARFL